jgi:hypothetical protein
MYGAKKRLDFLAGHVTNLELQIVGLQNEVETLRQISETLANTVYENHREILALVHDRALSVERLFSTESTDTRALMTKLYDDVTKVARAHHEDLRTLAAQNHADAWNADELRAQSLAEVVLLSIYPRIEAMKQEILALVGEKAVEVFRAQSNE